MRGKILYINNYIITSSKKTIFYKSSLYNIVNGLLPEENYIRRFLRFIEDNHITNFDIIIYPQTQIILFIYYLFIF